MIGDIIFLIITLFLTILRGFLSTINLAIPDGITDGITFFFSYLSNIGGVVNLPAFLGAISFFVTFLGLWYGYKLFLSIFSIFKSFQFRHPKHDA